MTDADGAVQRFLGEARFQIAQLALGTPPRQRAPFQRGDARGIVAAVFESLQRIDELPRHRLTTENPNDPAQIRQSPLPQPASCVLYALRPVSGKSKCMSGCDNVPSQMATGFREINPKINPTPMLSF
jgi:hypothetical protein